MPEQLAAQIEQSRRAVEALDLLEGGTVVARGVNYGTCFEIALKIRELSGLLFEAYSAADLMHGPVAAIGRAGPSSRSRRQGRRSRRCARPSTTWRGGAPT